MQIQISADNHIEAHENLEARISAVVQRAAGHFKNQISSVEVHLSQEGHSRGFDNKCCVLEVRIEGLHPTAVTEHASDLMQAVDGAADKMKHMLDATLQRRHDHRK